MQSTDPQTRAPRLRVQPPPKRATLIYDGDCRFCRCQVERWRRLTGSHVDYVSSQEVVNRGAWVEIPREAFDRSLQFVTEEGRVYDGAHGALLALSRANRHRWLLRSYQRSRLFASLLEWGYRTLAGHRGLISRFSSCARRLGKS